MKGEPYDSWNEGREAKIRYTLRSIPPKAHKNNATNTPYAPWRSHWEYPKPHAALTSRSYGEDRKNDEKRTFPDLEKREMRANWGDFGAKKPPLLHFNSASFALQSNLDWSSIQPRLNRNVGWIAPKGGFTEGHKDSFWNEEAAVDALVKGCF